MTNFNSNYFTDQKLRSLPFKKIGEGVLIGGTVSFVGPENVSVGDNVRIDALSMIIATRR